MTKDSDKNTNLVYAVEDRPKSVSDWIIYSLQWLITMVYAVVWGYAIVGIEMGFKSAELSTYMSSVILTIGLSTLLQAWLGHKMAMVSGPNVIPSLAIVAAITAGGAEYAQQAFLAQAIAGVFVVLLTFFGAVKYIQKIWSPLILGSMVMLVGLSISKQGLTLLTTSGFGWPFFVGIFLALIGIFAAIRGKGILGTLPPLIIIILGYTIFIIAGEFSWNLVQDPDIFILPAVFPYGFVFPPIDLIIIMIVVSLMSVLNLYGNLQGYAEVAKHKLKDGAIKRSFLLFGAIENCLPGIFGVPATVSYGENIGIVMLTRVAARNFILVASMTFIAMSFIGPVGGLMSAMPEPVAGAMLLGIASTVIGIGVNVMATAPEFGRREQSLVGFSVFLSLGLFLLPEEEWKEVHPVVTTIFSNPIISVILFVMLFEKVIFKKSKQV